MEKIVYVAISKYMESSIALTVLRSRTHPAVISAMAAKEMNRIRKLDIELGHNSSA